MNHHNSQSKLSQGYNFAQRNGFRGSFEQYVKNAVKCANAIRCRCGIPAMSKAEFVRRNS